MPATSPGTRSSSALRQRLLLNAGLAGLVLLLGSYLWLAPGEGDGSVPILELQDLDAGTLESFIVTRPGERLELVRDGERWRLESPWSLPADRAAVRRVLGRLPPTARRSYGQDELDLSAVGLGPDTLALTLPDGTSLRFGDRGAVDGLRFLGVGERVYLVEDGLNYLLAGGAASFTDKRPVPEGRRIEVLALPTLTLTRSAEGWLREPEDAAASDADQALVDRWEGTAALSVAPVADVAPLGGSTVRITLDGGELRSFVVETLPDGWRLLDVDAGVRFEMPGAARAALLAEDRGDQAP